MFTTGSWEAQRNPGIGSAKQWDSLLKKAGFSGADVFRLAYENENVCHYAVLMSSVLLFSSVENKDVEIICSEKLTGKMAELPVALSEMIKPSRLCSLATVRTSQPSGKWCIFLDKLNGSIMGSGGEASFIFAKRMLSTATGVLWITTGAAIESNAPLASIVHGLARTLRSENEGFRFVTLDLDSNRHISAVGTAEIIKRVFENLFSNKDYEYREHEYAERRGQIYIPRIVQDDTRNIHLGAGSGTLPLINVPFHGPDYDLKLQKNGVDKGKPLQWVADERLMNPSPVACDSITLKLGAATLDLTHNSKYYSYQGAVPSYGSFSGLITAVGKNVTSRFQIGDRVCGWSGRDVSPSINLKATSVQHIPDWMTFEQAASIPITYITVYYALVYLGRIQKGDSILIHGTSNALGEAALYLARYFEVNIYVTVPDKETERSMIDKFGIPTNRIYSAPPYRL